MPPDDITYSNVSDWLPIFTDFSPLCDRLIVFRGEFWSVKFIEIRGSVLFPYFKDTDLRETQKLKQKIEIWSIWKKAVEEHGPKRDPSKQNIETKNRNKWSQPLYSVQFF